MKTTLELPDETFRKAKIFAANNQLTLREIFTEALETFLEESEGKSKISRKGRLKVLLQEMQAENTEPMQPLMRDDMYDR